VPEGKARVRNVQLHKQKIKSVSSALQVLFQVASQVTLPVPSLPLPQSLLFLSRLPFDA